MTNVCVKTFGCSLNHADSERMIGSLLEYGYAIIENEREADIVVINSCAVKGPTESKLLTLLKKLKQQKKPVVVGGCMAQSMPEKFEGYTLIGTDQVDRVGEAVYHTLRGEHSHKLEEQGKNKLSLPSVRQNPFIEIIPISTGCLDACTYCITKKARGNFQSYPLKDIMQKIREAKHDGVKEIFLTSPDNGCWGKDRKQSLPYLMQQICTIKGDHMFRIGMANPNHIIRFLPELIAAFKHPQVYKFLHIPIQAGSNQVLKQMRRRYTVEQYRQIVEEFKRQIPEMTIATDIIVGYPTETPEQFEETLQLIRETQPDICNISRFWPRNHTAAASLPELPGDEMKRRAIAAMRTFREYATKENTAWLGWQGDVRITEVGKNGTMIARNHAYKQVILPKGNLGKLMNAKVVDVKAHYLLGEIVAA